MDIYIRRIKLKKEFTKYVTHNITYFWELGLIKFYVLEIRLANNPPAWAIALDARRMEMDRRQLEAMEQQTAILERIARAVEMLNEDRQRRHSNNEE